MPLHPNSLLSWGGYIRISPSAAVTSLVLWRAPRIGIPNQTIRDKQMAPRLRLRLNGFQTSLHSAKKTRAPSLMEKLRGDQA